MRPLDPSKQEKIIRAVFTITGRLGLAGINMTGISKEAGVGVGSLYTYFESKEEVIQAAYSLLEHEMTDVLYHGLKPDSTIKESIKSIFINTLNYRLKHYNETVFMDQYRQSNYIQLNFDKQIKEFEEQNKPLYDLLKKGQAEGVILKTDYLSIISFISNAIRSCASCISQKLAPMNKQTIEDGFLMMWKGISI